MAYPIPTLDEILNVMRHQRPGDDLRLVGEAYSFAAHAHDGQLRATGEPYFGHVARTALTLAKWGMDATTVAAGLIHDVPEDTAHTHEEVREHFGKEVAKLVDGITKLGTLKYRGLERYAENLRKMFVAMADDIRVILVKFADRLDNLASLGALPPVKQQRIARESIEIYAAIADRLGMGELRGEIEDAAFPFAAWAT
jgi:GTP pyrophosphokinase